MGFYSITIKFFWLNDNCDMSCRIIKSANFVFFCESLPTFKNSFDHAVFISGLCFEFLKNVLGIFGLFAKKRKNKGFGGTVL